MMIDGKEVQRKYLHRQLNLYYYYRESQRKGLISILAFPPLPSPLLPSPPLFILTDPFLCTKGQDIRTRTLACILILDMHPLSFLFIVTQELQSVWKLVGRGQSSEEAIDSTDDHELACVFVCLLACLLNDTMCTYAHSCMYIHLCKAGLK